MTAPLIEGRGRKGGLLFHHYCLLRNPITIIIKARKKCPRRKEPFNKGCPGLWRHGVEGEAQAQKTVCLPVFKGADAQCFYEVHLSKA